MENKWNLFEKFLITENVDLSITDFLIASVLIVLMSWILSLTYQKVAKSLSNRKDFSANFMLLSFTTMVIITIVKSSLALSLGLVGALSIVRFRSAIKEPEELAYLFIAIALGLGLGANQIYIVLIAFVVLMAILWSRFFLTKSNTNQNLFVTINAKNDQKIELDELKLIIGDYFSKYQLKRFDESEDYVEISYIADIKSVDRIDSFRKEILSKYPNANLSFLDSKAY
jgi:hypothetical protein